MLPHGSLIPIQVFLSTSTQRAPCVLSSRTLLYASAEGFRRHGDHRDLVRQQEGSVESRTSHTIVNMYVSDLAESPSSS